MVDWLIRTGANYDIESAVVQADEERVNEILQSAPGAISLLPHEKQVVIVHMAIDKPTIMKLLLEHGANPNIRSKTGVFVTPPITRVREPEVAELLLEHGADLSATDAEGRTRMQTAQRQKEEEMKAVLLRYASRVSPKKKRN